MLAERLCELGLTARAAVERLCEQGLTARAAAVVATFFLFLAEECCVRLVMSPQRYATHP